jgi:hypothetical protein
MDQVITSSNKVITMRQGKQRQGLLKFIEDLPSNLLMAEVGCYAGESTEMFLQSGKVRYLYAIDLWEGGYDPEDLTSYSDFANVEREFDKRLKEFQGFVKIKADSIMALSMLHDLDMVYLDGNHLYENISQELTLAKRALKRGGIIAGHNYDDEFDVRRAVDEMFGKPDKTYEDTSWLIYIK